MRPETLNETILQQEPCLECGFVLLLLINDLSFFTLNRQTHLIDYHATMVGHPAPTMKVPIPSENLIPEDDISLTQDARNNSQAWKPSWLHFRPILGIVSLGVTIGCMMASFAVLWISDGEPVNTWYWKVQPTVYVTPAVWCTAYSQEFEKTRSNVLVATKLTRCNP